MIKFTKSYRSCVWGQVSAGRLLGAYIRYAFDGALNYLWPLRPKRPRYTGLYPGAIETAPPRFPRTGVPGPSALRILRCRRREGSAPSHLTQRPPCVTEGADSNRPKCNQDRK